MYNFDWEVWEYSFCIWMLFGNGVDQRLGFGIWVTLGNSAEGKHCLLLTPNVLGSIFGGKKCGKQGNILGPFCFFEVVVDTFKKTH